MKRAGGLLVVMLPTVLTLSSVAGDAPSTPALAEKLIGSSGFTGGLAVHIGCADGALTAELCAGGRFVVHGLALDRVSMAKARQTIAARGLYGRVSAERASIERLPYADSLVNLVVIDDLSRCRKAGLSLKEVFRVLCPNGAALVCDSSRKLSAAGLKQELARAGVKSPEVQELPGTWLKAVKLRPAGMDDWTHYDHGPDRNRVSQDRLIGPPERLQWIAEPTLARHHYSRPSGWVSAGGRVFYVYDDMPPVLAGSIRLALTARDAYSGVQLWKRPIELPRRLRRNERAFASRALVATGDRVYTALATKGPLLALDAATGTTVRNYQTHATEVLHLKGVLILGGAGGPVRAVRAETGKLIWKYAGSGRSLIAGGGKAFFESGREIVCVGVADGRKRWSVPLASRRICSFYRDTVVLGSYGKTRERKVLHAISPATGQELWRHEYPDMRGYNLNTGSPTEVFCMGGLIWALNGTEPHSWVGVDPAEGTVKRRAPYQPGVISFKIRRCSPSMATERYFLTGPGMDFLEWQTGSHSRSRACRSACHWGLGLANGMVYAFPVDCLCFGTIRGVTALAPEPARSRPTTAPAEPLIERGPAWGAPPAATGPRRQSDWPTYRHGPGRSGAASTLVPAKLDELWRRRLPGRLTAPVVAEGKLFVARRDAHQVIALDAATGKDAWTFTAGGPIDSPPTVYKGLCLQGCRDGWVYCLRASDGKLVWRLRAAPADRRIVAFGQIESAWPVHGAVLVDGGLACFAAGWSSETDGGIHLYAVRPRTGTVVWRKHVGKIPVSPAVRDYAAKSYLRSAGKLSDVLVSDGLHCYMWKSLRLTLKDGRPVRRGPPLVGGRNGLLDSSFKDSWSRGYRRASGQMLVYEKARTFGVTARAPIKSGRYIRPGQGDYTLFCRKVGTDGKPAKDDPGWSIKAFPVAVRAMVLAGEKLFVAGPPDRPDPRGGQLWSISAADGSVLEKYDLDAAPVFDGMAAANGRLYLCARDGGVWCLGRK